jgi:hypothetical protein
MSNGLAIASLIVAGASFIVAGLSFGYAVRRGNREQQNREHELGLMQEQIDSRRRADVSAEILTRRPANDDRGDDEYEIRLTNGGPAVARQLQVWVQVGDGLDGLPATQPLHPALPPMQPGEHHPLPISVPPRFRFAMQQVSLYGSWLDESGFRTELLHHLG